MSPKDLLTSRTSPWSLSSASAPLEGLEFALTIDDAPGLPGRMDSVLAALQEASIEHCVAFVVGKDIAGQEDALRRWLAAGFELGNHTWSHLRASEHSAEEILNDVARCDAALAELGAFANGRPRYFRFPYLDRGQASDSAALAAGLAKLGYRCVHGSIDWFDYHYDTALRRLAEADDAAARNAIAQRYCDVACEATRYEMRRARQHLGRQVHHIGYCHFGAVTVRVLPEILRRLQAGGVVFTDTADAVRDEVFADFESDPTHSGRVPPAVFSRGAVGTLKRWLSRCSWRLGLLGQKRLGPRWPMWLE